MRYLLTFIITAFFSTTTVFGQEESDSIYKNWVDLNKISAIDFINMLPVKDTSSMNIITTFTTAEIGWIKENEIDTLISLIDSKELANCVMQSISSHLPINETSTVGGQVMNLIDAYRLKKEYPFFSTDCSKNDEKRKSEILEWYKNLK